MQKTQFADATAPTEQVQDASELNDHDLNAVSGGAVKVPDDLRAKYPTAVE